MASMSRWFTGGAIAMACLGMGYAIAKPGAPQKAAPQPKVEAPEAMGGQGTDAPPAAPAPVAPEAAAAAQAAWGDVYRVLTHPRCLNCHPAGDRPLQTDASTPHKMNISRRSEANGLACAACHREVNSEALGIPGGPPGAPHWQLPAADMPLVFQGHTAASLCAQLKDPARNGGKDLAALLVHVRDDALVKWGWQPGGDRTVPPLSHPAFVEAFQRWVDGGGACPPEG